MEFRHLEKVLEQYGRMLIDTYRDNLAKKDRVSTGNLINSVRLFVDKDGEGFEVSLELADYWKYIEDGRKSYRGDENWKQHMPPLSKIRDWVMIKPVLPSKPMKNGKLPDINQLPYMIQRGITLNGIKPTNALGDASDFTWENFQTDIYDALNQDLSDEVKVLIAVW